MTRSNSKKICGNAERKWPRAFASRVQTPLFVAVLLSAGAPMSSKSDDNSGRPQFMPMQAVLDSVRTDSALSGAITFVGQSLTSFESVWRSRTRAQDQFIVTAIVKDQNRLVPTAVLVDRMDRHGVHGLLVMHSPTRITNVKATCRWDQVVDWRYREMMYMKGGPVFRVLLDRSSAVTQRTIVDELPFVVNRDESVSPNLYTLLRDIANGRNEALGDRCEAYRETRFKVPIPQHELSRRPAGEFKFSLGEFICMYGDRESISVARRQNLLQKEVAGEYSLLAFSSLAGNAETTDALIDVGCDVDGTDSDGGLPPLSTAAHGGHLRVVETLADAGADINKAGFNGRTPIFFASSLEVAKLLLDRGARLDVQDVHNHAPFNAAMDFGRPEVASFLRQHAIAPRSEAVDPDETIGRDEMFSLLQEAGASDAELAAMSEALAVDYGFVLPVAHLPGGM